MPASPPPITTTRRRGAHALLPARLRSATQQPSRPPTARRAEPARARGSASMRIEQAVVDAAHREHARRRCAGRAAATSSMPRSNHCCARSASKRTSAVQRAPGRRHRRAPRAPAPAVGGAGRRDDAEAPQVLGRAGRRGRSRRPRARRAGCSSAAARRRGRRRALRRARAQARRGGLLAHAEDRQAHAPDRAGDATAVEHELVEALVGRRRRRPCARPRSARPARRAAARSAGARRRAPRSPRRCGACMRRPRLASSSAQLRRRRRRAARACARDREVAVADVVDAPRERVDRAHRAPALAREQADAVVEVGGLLARDRLAARVGLARRHRLAHAACPAAASWAVAHELARRAARAPTRRWRRSSTPASAREPAPARGARRAGEDVVARALDRVERRAPAGDERRRRRAARGRAARRPAALRRRAARARAPPRRRARRAAAAGAVAPRARRRPVSSAVVAAEAREVLGRQVDAPGGEVLGDVLAVLGQLQRRADRVRQRDPLRAWPRRTRRARARRRGRPTARSSRAAAAQVS